MLLAKRTPRLLSDKNEHNMGEGSIQVPSQSIILQSFTGISAYARPWLRKACPLLSLDCAIGCTVVMSEYTESSTGSYRIVHSLTNEIGGEGQPGRFNVQGVQSVNLPWIPTNYCHPRSNEAHQSSYIAHASEHDQAPVVAVVVRKDLTSNRYPSQAATNH